MHYVQKKNDFYNLNTGDNENCKTGNENKTLNAKSAKTEKLFPNWECMEGNFRQKFMYLAFILTFFTIDA